MSVTSVTKDLDRAALRVEAEYRATVARVWQLWADPRQLERWWGPPTYPATVTHHDLAAGGTVQYHMTGPEGDKHHGGWRVVRAEEPHLIEFEDYFADDTGNENADLPQSKTVVSIEDIGNGTTRMSIDTRYASTEALQQVLEMGMEEGMRQALGQIGALLQQQPV